MLLAIDPGVVSPGVALFAGGQLVASSRIVVKKLDACLGERWFHASMAITGWALPHGPISTVVYEKPKIYTRVKSKGDPDDLLGLCAIGAGVAGMVSQHCKLAVTTYEPSEWIGQVSKVCPACNGKAKKKCRVCAGSAWLTPRGSFIRSRLSIEELENAPDQNDAIDAIGLGLKHLGRLEPKRAFSNGR